MTHFTILYIVFFLNFLELFHSAKKLELLALPVVFFVPSCSVHFVFSLDIHTYRHLMIVREFRIVICIYRSNKRSRQ